jgi:hypothetical protein
MNTSSADFMILFSRFRNLREITSMPTMLRGINNPIKITIKNCRLFNESANCVSTLLRTNDDSSKMYSTSANSPEIAF